MREVQAMIKIAGGIAIVWLVICFWYIALPAFGIVYTYALISNRADEKAAAKQKKAAARYWL